MHMTLCSDDWGVIKQSTPHSTFIYLFQWDGLRRPISPDISILIKKTNYNICCLSGPVAAIYLTWRTAVSNRHGVVVVWVRVLCWSDKLLASANRPTINSHNGSCLVLDRLLGMIITKASRKCRRAHLSANENDTNGRFTISMEYSIHSMYVEHKVKEQLKTTKFARFIS